MYFLAIHSPDGVSRCHRIQRPILRVGRASINDLVLRDEGVSRSHFQISDEADGCYLADLGSKQGTFLNATRLTHRVRLREHDRIQAGMTRLDFSPASPVLESSPHALPEKYQTASLSLSEFSERISEELQCLTKGFSPGRPEPEASARSTDFVMSASPLAMSSGASNLVLKMERESIFQRPVGELLEVVMELAAQAIHYDHGVLMLFNEEGELVPRVRRPREFAGKRPDVSRTITKHVILRHEALLVSNTLRDPMTADKESIAGQLIRSAICVPLWIREDVIGLIYLASLDPAVQYTERDLHLLTFFSGVAAIKIENARLFDEALIRRRRDEEFREASRIQSSLLPSRAPEIANYQLEGSTFPCEEIGGDYYDYIALPDGRIGIAEADVAGHGLPAALLMNYFTARLSALWESGLPPDEMFRLLNEALCRWMPENRFITFFYGLLDPKDHSLTYVNAGHSPPLLIRPAAAPESLGITGLFLGSFPGIGFRTGTVWLEPGSILLLPSDGITETRDTTGEMFGDEGLIRAVKELAGGTPDEIIKKIIDRTRLHRAGGPQEDDMTLVVLKRNQ